MRRARSASITAEGLFLEQLETNPARFLPEISESELEEPGGVTVRLGR